VKWSRVCAAAIAALIASALAAPPSESVEAACSGPPPSSDGYDEPFVIPYTSAVIDGELYAMVRSGRGRYLFGASGAYLRSFDELPPLLRALGLHGSDAELVRFALDAPQIVGGEFADGGSIGYFIFECPGRYRLTAVVRKYRRAGWVTPTRIWLQDRRGTGERVVRSFCMKPKVLPVGARIAVTFRRPLGSSPPRYEIDRDGDGVFERSGPFRKGGAGFPSSIRC
jgi:hypothetical protein